MYIYIYIYVYIYIYIVCLHFVLLLNNRIDATFRSRVSARRFARRADPSNGALKTTLQGLRGYSVKRRGHLTLEQARQGRPVVRNVGIHPAAVRCDMVLHLAFRGRRVQQTASAVRCDMMLHRAFRTRHLNHEI